MIGRNGSHCWSRRLSLKLPKYETSWKTATFTIPQDIAHKSGIHARLIFRTSCNSEYYCLYFFTLRWVASSLSLSGFEDRPLKFVGGSAGLCAWTVHGGL